MMEGGLLAIGGKFGAYDVLKLLGRGGMGEVYLLRSPSDGELYACKLMFPPSGCNDVREAYEWRRRFANEAIFAMKVTHRNLIRVYDAGEDPDTHLCYIIMDYMSGGTLAERIRSKGRLGIAEAVKIAVKVASALEVAHRAGIVHRDIKPDNIMFDGEDEPRLADLGIAKFSSGVTNATMTKTEMIVGTPTYMAPEQMMDSHNVDARADVYSLGMVLYEMLTGTHPREGATVIELLAKAVKGEELPNVCAMRPEVSAALGYVISKMTASTADARPSTAMEAAKMLHDAYVGSLSAPANQPMVSPGALGKGGATMVSRWVTLLAFALLVSACIVAVSTVWSKREPPAARGYADAAVEPSTVIITNEISKTLYKTVVVTNALGGAGGVAKSTGASSGATGSSHAENRNNGVGKVNKSKKSKANGLTWWYVGVEGGVELTSSGVEGLDSKPCVEGEVDGVVVIPEKLEGKRVVGIGRWAFNGCDGITFVSIPEGVERVEAHAFEGCKRLKRVRVPSTAKVDWSAFGACTGLETVDIDWANPHYKVVGGLVWTKDMTGFVKFPAASRARKIVFPKGVTRICEYAFSGCGMKSFAVPGSVLRIEEGAFSGCSRLAEITFGGELESIGSFAFAMSGLKAIAIPRGVKEICGETFRGCVNLAEIKFPETLERFAGDGIFDGCRSLKKVEFAGDAPSIAGDQQLFPEEAADAIVVVRGGTKGWNGSGSTDLPGEWPNGEKTARPICISAAGE